MKFQETYAGEQTDVRFRGFAKTMNLEVALRLSRHLTFPYCS